MKLNHPNSLHPNSSTRVTLSATVVQSDLSGSNVFLHQVLALNLNTQCISLLRSLRYGEVAKGTLIC